MNSLLKMNVSDLLLLTVIVTICTNLWRLGQDFDWVAITLGMAFLAVWAIAVVRRHVADVPRMRLITPIEVRPPFFDGWETDRATYRFPCAGCGGDIVITFAEMLHAAWGWKGDVAELERMTLASIFQIDLMNRSIENGMNAVVRSSCTKCGAVYFSHFWFHEYRHSTYQISLRAIASVTRTDFP